MSGKRIWSGNRDGTEHRAEFGSGAACASACIFTRDGRWHFRAESNGPNGTYSCESIKSKSGWSRKGWKRLQTAKRRAEWSALDCIHAAHYSEENEQ